MRRAQIARLTKLESLSLNCGHPRDGFKDGGDGIIQLVKQLPHLLLLRVQLRLPHALGAAAVGLPRSSPCATSRGR